MRSYDNKQATTSFGVRKIPPSVTDVRTTVRTALAQAGAEGVRA